MYFSNMSLHIFKEIILWFSKIEPDDPKSSVFLLAVNSS